MREQFRTDSGVRQGCIISLWLFNVYMDAVMKDMKMGMGRRGESGDYLVSCIKVNWLCGELEENLRAMVGWFVDVSTRRGLKVNAGKSKVMVLNGEEVYIDGICLEHISEFKYLGCVLDELCTDEEECSRKVLVNGPWLNG